MSDPLERDGDRMFAAAAEYGRTYWGWDKDTEPEVDPVDDLLERAENANSPEVALAYAQMATARAIQAQTVQARIRNLIVVAQAEPDYIPGVLDDLRMGTAGLVWEGLGLLS